MKFCLKWGTPIVTYLSYKQNLEEEGNPVSDVDDKGTAFDTQLHPVTLTYFFFALSSVPHMHRNNTRHDVPAGGNKSDRTNCQGRQG